MNTQRIGAHQPQGDRDRSRSPVRLQEGRDRSRSPINSSLQATAKSTSRAEKLSDKRKARWEKAAQEMEARKDEFEESRKRWAAEDERRRNLRPEERLREDGENLLRQIKAESRAVFVLQESPHTIGLRKAKCRAADCFYVQVKNPNGPCIIDDYRICLDWGRSYDGKHFYHVLCIDWMIDLDELVDTKFFLDGNPSMWGLMVREWFEHKGCISLDKVAEYINQYKAYEEELDKHSRKWDTWWVEHSLNKEEHDDERPTCECHSMPNPPEKPVLRDYTTSEEDRCSIADVMNHPQMEVLPARHLLARFQGPGYQFPERKETKPHDGPSSPDAEQRDESNTAVE